MPEGDTLRKVAGLLGPMLEGEVVTEAWLREEDRFRRDPTPRRLAPVEALAGTACSEVRAVGKHLLIALGDEVVRVHLGMHGSFHRYAPGEGWQRPRRQAWLVLHAAGHVVVCFNAKTVARHRADRLDRVPALARLGPDLLGDEVPFAAIVERARQSRRQEVGPLLLDQAVAAGIGNVYKSEVLFLERVDPWARVEDLSDAVLESLYRRARELLAANLGPGRRRTVPRTAGPRPVGSVEPTPRCWVYGREDRPCLACSTPIQSGFQGPHARSTWWCPRCQRRLGHDGEALEP